MRLIGRLCAIGFLAGACQSGAGAQQPALLMQGDRPAMERLKAALAREMGRTAIDLGPSDPTRRSIISVLPVPAGAPNDRDMALPTVFRLEFDGQVCALVREETGARIVLDGVACRAAPAQ